MDYLWRELRPEVTRAVTAAAAEGDRSENAEYIYRKKQLREIDRRVRFLGKRLDVLKVVKEKPRDLEAIYFGARVTLENEKGETVQYRIVGSDELDPSNGFISVDSPMARALLKKRIEDEVTVDMPQGSRSFVIVDVQY